MGSREIRSLRKEELDEGWVGADVCVARAGREFLRGLTLSSWEVSPSLHTLPMLPSQAKLPLGQELLEILESWENVCVRGGRGTGLRKEPPRLSEGSAKLPWEEGIVKGVRWEPGISWTRAISSPLTIVPSTAVLVFAFLVIF